MVTKKNNVYKVSFQEIALKDGATPEKSVEFEFENHDNVFSIIEKLQQNKLLGSGVQELQFALGLKLFGDVLMKHKNNPLFEEMKPAFIQFMTKLKGNVKS